MCEDIQADVEDGQLQFFYMLAFVLQGDKTESTSPNVQILPCHQHKTVLLSELGHVCVCFLLGKRLDFKTQHDSMAPRVFASTLSYSSCLVKANYWKKMVCNFKMTRFDEWRSNGGLEYCKRCKFVFVCLLYSFFVCTPTIVLSIVESFLVVF